MKRYLVGGAVRDRLLGLPVGERDWVVVGESPQSMVERGFKPVGRDFPVFLHPETGEEHALARTERKHGTGYHGFVFHAGPEVTLEQDLQRRDLTVNAIAQADDGQLIDPCGGRADLDARRLRHVSPAFAEDPVRIPRIARFHARFAGLGFGIAEETLALMRNMVEAGEGDALVAERVWQETARALTGPDPWTYFETLRACGALARLFPEIEALHGVPQPARHHPEIDTGVHVGMALARAAEESQPLAVMYAVLCHDLGKALTPAEHLPSHRQHEQRGLPLVHRVSERFRVPGDCRELAVIVAREHLNVHRALELRPGTLLSLLERLDAFRQPQRLPAILAACRCDARGRLGLEQAPYPQADYLQRACEVAAAVSAADVDTEGLRGAQIGAAIRELREQRLTEFVRAERAGSGG